MSNLQLKVWEAWSLPSNWFSRQKSKDKQTNKAIEKKVRGIIKQVIKNGDSSLVELTERFDKVIINPEKLRTLPEEIREAYSKVNKKQISALEFIRDRVASFEKLIAEQMRVKVSREGVFVQKVLRPIESVGCYIPGGKASYPSTVVMTVVPAKVAGVPRIVVCSPPNAEGIINPLTLVAADICGANEIYKIGGAQAIASLAYGTETIHPVKKIVGPGNKYVTAAKLLVSRDVAIDMPAGPSEVLILADESANPRFIARDMISQAEHSEDSVAGLITTSQKLKEEALYWLRKMIDSASRSRIIANSLNEYGFIIVCDNLEQMVRLANVFAPEHIEIMTHNPNEVSDNITSAGEILLGPLSPVSLSDYGSGTNHVLPTGGSAHVCSGLSVLDFARRVSVVKGSRVGLQKLKECIKVLTETENLPNHFKAIEERCENEN